VKNRLSIKRIPRGPNRTAVAPPTDTLADAMWMQARVEARSNARNALADGFSFGGFGFVR